MTNIFVTIMPYFQEKMSVTFESIDWLSQWISNKSARKLP